VTLVLLSICGNKGHCSDNNLTMVTVRLIVVYKEAYKKKRNSSHSERHLRHFKLLSSADILMYNSFIDTNLIHNFYINYIKLSSSKFI
jgi:hypothetical protein